MDTIKFKMKEVGVEKIEFVPIDNNYGYFDVIEPESIIAMANVFPLTMGSTEFKDRDTFIDYTRSLFHESKGKLTPEEEDQWFAWAYSIAVSVANVAFRNPILLEALLNLGGIIVEDSKNLIWGNGQNGQWVKNDYGAAHGLWGHALMRIRSNFNKPEISSASGIVDLAPASSEPSSHLARYSQYDLVPRLGNKDDLKTLIQSSGREEKLKSLRFVSGPNVWTSAQCRIEFNIFFNTRGKEVLSWLDKTKEVFLDPSDFIYSLPTSEKIVEAVNRSMSVAMSAANITVESDIKCRKCHKNATPYLQQTRRADEAPTLMGRCYNTTSGCAVAQPDRDGHITLVPYEFRA